MTSLDVPPLAIDLPEVKAEVEAAFANYERALVENDVATLEALFWDDLRTIRYGGGENLYGMPAIRAFRRGRSPAGLDRTLSQTVITTYGRDAATSMTLFRRARTPGRVGRQSQTWVRSRTAGKSSPRMSVRSTDRAEAQFGAPFGIIVIVIAPAE